MICPYCDIEIDESLVESEEGCCPECGVFLGVGSGYSDDGGGRGSVYDDDEDDDTADHDHESSYEDELGDIEYDDIELEDGDGYDN
jgi:hypothetical protein